MAEPIIKGGCFFVSRKLINSGIMNKPPEYLKVWIYLLSEAFFKDKEGLKRGQGFTSLPDIMDVLTYKVGYRTERPTKKKVFGIIEWLRNPNEGYTNVPMIVTTKVTHGFIYTIENYDLYQTIENYEGNNEGTAKEQRRERQGNNTKKNDKECKNVKKETYSENTILSDTIYDFIAMRKSIKKPMTDRAITLLLNKLKKLSDSEDVQIKMLEESIINCWQGVFPLKIDNAFNDVSEDRFAETRRKIQERKLANG